MTWVVQIPWAMITVTCVFMLFDIVTGLLQAFKNKDVSSKVMRDGLWHKCGFLAAIAFGVLCAAAIELANIQFDIPACEAICGYILLCECISIVENIGRLNPEAYEFLKKFFNKNTPAGEEKYMPEEEVDNG